MDTSIYSKPDMELLEWELGLTNNDLRAHAWYHGNMPRNLAEILLEEDGEFLVRDSSTFARSGDYVLSTKWNGTVLHFLIHKEVLQPNTIYEQLGYRFENESFTTVQDLITYYVGNREPISHRSGAIISQPRTRVVPISRKDRINLPESLDYAEYASIAQEAARQVLPVEALLIEKSFVPEGMYNNVALNLKPPQNLLEDLQHVPDKIKNLDEYLKCVSLQPPSSNVALGSSNFDLTTFSSILLPMNMEEVTMNPNVIEQINSRILEVSDRVMAITITSLDMKILKQELLQEDDNEDESPASSELDPSTTTANKRILKRISEHVLSETEFRWNHVIERSLTFSHFVAVTVLGAQVREDMISKWVGIAQELKISMGNFFSLFAIMRGLTCTKLSSMDGPVDWMKLRRNYTNSAFLFETSLRNTYHKLLQGTESYPPNTIIPNLLTISLIFEGNTDLLPSFNCCSEEDKLKMTVAHLKQFYTFSCFEDTYNRNWERVQNESNIAPDIILTDICRTETQLLILWGIKYNSSSLLERCKEFDSAFV
ncbi:Breast cancer anti-estrogen resistance protein 3 [Folsomia candida]|uniref:Breast cancer anti-estrogen resistance protein 3 n=1 Tax=Folsomia candida TaxID=158441 RepID=A0A226EKX4_FOLCA|nr:Breast cancer anti-estrogen resistance protein 3 [Folsomia candida]